MLSIAGLWDRARRLGFNGSVAALLVEFQDAAGSDRLKLERRALEACAGLMVLPNPSSSVMKSVTLGSCKAFRKGLSW